MKKLLLIAALILVGACSSQKANLSNTNAKALTPEQMQKYMQEAGAPGNEHATLKQLTGEWNAVTKFWMDPSAKPEVSKGKAKASMLYGGRYLLMTYKGKAMGQNFEGQSIMGYDNVNKKYFSTWIDNMNTGLNTSEGYADQTGKVITMNSTFVCPMTHASVDAEDVFTIVDKNHFTYEMYKIENGKKLKNLEITYTRK